MANIENLKKFQDGYEHAFALDWIENLSWKNIREATVSCDEGRRRISNFKKDAFVNLATALLEGEYIDAEDVINQLHNEMLVHWEQEHYALPVHDSHINNLKISLMREYETLDGELRYLFDQIGLLLRTVSEKLVYQSNECIFNATTYESPEELVIDYIGILSQLIIPICSFEHKLPFGISTCYTSANYKDIASDEFFDLMIDSGALFCWFFHYMPVGNGAVKELLPTPEQRAYVYHQIRKFRSEKPIFTMDFQNDAQYVGGCIAGGRRYLHINAKGDVEPCVFIHYSNSNIHNTTLLDALRSPLFQAYHDNQPFNENMLRPCPMLENAGRIQELVKQSKAVNTDYESPEDVDHLLEKTVPYAKNWKPMADKLWNEQKK